MADSCLVATANSGQEAVDQLIVAYRRFGNLNAKINPLGYEEPVDTSIRIQILWQLTESDLSRKLF